MSGEDEMILGFLLLRACQEEGSVKRIANEAARHGFINTKPWTREEAKANADAVDARVRELLGHYVEHVGGKPPPEALSNPTVNSIGMEIWAPTRGALKSAYTTQRDDS